MLNFTDWPWRYWQQQQPEQLALYLEQQPLNWQQLCQRIDLLAAELYQQGIRPHHTIALRGKNSQQFLLTLLALWQCGARVLPLNPQLPQSMLEQLQAVLLLDYGIDLTGEQRIASLPLCQLPSTAPLTASQLPATEQTATHWQAERVVSLILTSGSTGLAKAAAHSARAHLASARGVLSLIPFNPSDCWLLSLPLFHVSGQGILWRWLLAGARLAVRQTQSLAVALTGCTHASLVPTQLWRLLQQPILPADLTTVLLGGASIPPALPQAAQQQRIACWCGYGLTEFASTVCAKRADGLADVGTVLPGCELRLAEGEIWLRGDSLAAGYWQAGALCSLLNVQGWFATRDCGELHNEQLTVCGRLDNLFFTGGESIQPEYIERIIASHPAVQQVFIVPLASDEFGHIPVAVVDCQPATDLTAGFINIADWCTDKLASYQRPRYWLALPAHLQNGGIKISRHELQQWVASEITR